MNYKLLVLDLDGTLTNSSKVITPRTKEALLRAQAKGVRLVLASGRPTYGIVPLAEELSLSRYGGYIMAFNGGRVVDCTRGAVLFEQMLDEDLLPLLHDRTLEAGLAILTYQGQVIATTRAADEYVAIEATINRMPVEEYAPFLERIEHPLNKCLIVGEPARLALLERRLAAETAGRLNVFRSADYFLECVPPNIDKAQSLARLIAEIGVAQEEVIACGDHYNDLSMIRFAGLGVAMANAVEGVKAAADHVTLSNEEDGIAAVVERFIDNKS